MKNQRLSTGNSAAVARLLKGLHLEEQTGAIVASFTFTEETQPKLRKWLSEAAIGGLQTRVGHARHFEQLGREAATIRGVGMCSRALASSPLLSLRQFSTLRPRSSAI